MRSRFLAIFVAPVMVTALLVALPASEAAQAAGCDPEYVSVSGPRIYVEPTGVDDTSNLQCALDAAAAMRRGEVRLARGDFFTSFLAVEGLNGTVRGAGSELTHVYSLPEGIDCIGQFALTGETSMLRFGGGDVTLRGFSVGIGGDHVCEAPRIDFVNPDGTGVKDGSIEAIGVLANLPVAGLCPDPQPVALKVVDLAVDGALFYDLEGPIRLWDGFSHAILASPFHQTYEACPGVRLVGDIVVQNSRFDDVLLGVTAVMVDDSTVRVTGNRFHDSLWGVTIVDFSGSRAVVSHNDMAGVLSFGVFGIADALPGDEPFRLDVRNNTIGVLEEADGIAILDFAGEFVGQPLIDATVIGNEIELVDTSYNGIFVVGDPEGLIAGNHVYGFGSAGVTLFADSWRVIDNDFTGLEPLDGDVVVLGNENRIVCHSPDDEVLDLGFDNVTVGCSVIAFGEDLGLTTESEAARVEAAMKGAEGKLGQGW